jgi:hypothetical protein
MHDGRDHDDIATAQQRVRRRVPQSLDLGVDRRVLLDEGVRLRHVCLRLVVVVVADEVLDRVVRHQLAELVRQLRRERLVVRQDERRTLHLLDEPCRRRRLSRTGRAQQHDVGLAGVDACRELGNRLRLITARRILADDLERADGSRGLHDSSVGGATDTRAGVRRGHVRRTSTPYAGDMLEFLVGSSLAAAAGLNAWMPLFALGLLDRLLPGIDLPNAWSWLLGRRRLWIIGTCSSSRSSPTRSPPWIRSTM